MKTFLVTFLTICSSVFASAQTAISQEEYSIYSLVLADIHRQNVERDKEVYSFVILSETLTESDIEETKSISPDSFQKDKMPLKLERFFKINSKYEIIDRSELDKLFELGKQEKEKISDSKYRNDILKFRISDNDTWNPFFGKYPTSNGYSQFSRVEFSKNKKNATVEYERRSSVSGENLIYFLRKNNKRWEIKESGGGFWIAGNYLLKPNRQISKVRAFHQF